MAKNKHTADLTTELSLVVGALIFVIAAAIIIPNIINASQRKKQTSTMTDLRAMGTAIEEYHVDQKLFPAGTFESSNLSTYLVPNYMMNVPEEDGWGNRLQYESDGKTYYKIISVGSNHKNDAATTYRGPIMYFENDIVFSNGSFIAIPEGMAQ